MRTLTAAPTPSSLRSELDDSDLKCWDLPEGQPPPGQKHAGLPGLDWGGSTLDLMFNEITKYWHEKGNLKKKKNAVNFQSLFFSLMELYPLGLSKREIFTRSSNEMP